MILVLWLGSLPLARLSNNPATFAVWFCESGYDAFQNEAIFNCRNIALSGQSVPIFGGGQNGSIAPYTSHNRAQERAMISITWGRSQPGNAHWPVFSSTCLKSIQFPADAPKQSGSPGEALTLHERRKQFRKSCAAGRGAYQRAQDDRSSHTAMMLITVLGAVFM